VDAQVEALERGTFYSKDDHAFGPFVAGLPDGDYADPRLMVLVKGRNNGTVYLAAPYELPWLSEFLESEVDGRGRPAWPSGF
jgi:hypothetical protein